MLLLPPAIQRTSGQAEASAVRRGTGWCGGRRNLFYLRQFSSQAVRISQGHAPCFM